MTKDLSIFEANTPLYNHKLIQNDETATTITGTQKLLQKFIMRLMTVTGSMPYKPLDGTMFASFAAGGLFETEIDVLATFSASVSDLIAEFRLDEDDNTPDNEKFESATMEILTIEPGKITTKVTVVALDDSTASAVLPVSFTL